MKQYDFVFAGGGLAGLSLAHHMLQSSLRGSSMLLIDRADKTRNDRTWCFWSDQPTLFDQIVSHTWKRLEFIGDHFQKQFDLQNYSYKMIRGIDLYTFAHECLSAASNVEFLHGEVERIDERANGASVFVNGERIAARWVFDSRFSLAHLRLEPKRFHTLCQYFRGWFIETPRNSFNLGCATFMDFRAQQKDEMRFFYLLPLSPTRALVEFVTQSPAAFDRELRAYLETVLGIRNYRILEREGGVNPMTDFRFARQASAHVTNIGIRGGRIKPTSGYAFTRIQRDSAAIVKSLERFGVPFHVPADSGYYRLCDTLMLDIMQHRGEQIRPLFTTLFKNNPIERILHFLDEAATLAENLKLIASLPPKLFFQALFRLSSPDKAIFSRSSL